MRLDLVATIIAIVLGAFHAKASLLTLDHQIHGRSGMLMSSYSGPGIANGSFAIPNALDVELQFFQDSKKAYVVRSILGMDFSTALVRYTYAGIGQRLYLWSKGKADSASQAGDSVTSLSRWRYYVGWDAGIAQLLVINYGPVLSSYSTVFEPSASVGAMYRVTKDLSVDVNASYGMGFGFSSVSVTTSTMRMLLGAALSF